MSMREANALILEILGEDHPVSIAIKSQEPIEMAEALAAVIEIAQILSAVLSMVMAEIQDLGNRVEHLEGFTSSKVLERLSTAP
jgi:hypothetical protein